MNIVGKSIIRPDAINKVRGLAKYPDDIEFDDMLYAGVVRTTIAYGKVIASNIDEIKRMPGIVKVIDYNMLPGAKKHGVIFKDIPILIKDTFKRVGDCIYIVVAEDKTSLRHGLDAFKIDYEEYEGVFSINDALKDDAPIIGDNSNILYDLKIKRGDTEQGFNEAAYITENWYSTQMVEHAFMQPECAVARLINNNSIEIYVATQYPHYDREEVSRALNFKEENVIINNTVIGGAFGAREDINPQCHVAIASYITKKPVKILYTRDESTTSHSKRHPMKMYYKTAINNDGKLCALEAKIYGDSGAYASWGMNILRKAAVHASGPYFIPNVDIRSIAVYTNNPFAGAMRGFGAAQVPIAMESQIDILAKKIGIHPLKLRYLNAFDKNSVTATGQVLKGSVGIKKCIEELAINDNVNLG